MIDLTSFFADERSVVWHLAIPYGTNVMNPEVDEIELKRISWRCRRGMRELDQLFERYLRHYFQKSSPAERAVFLQLLDCEDDKLWRWFMGYDECADEALADLIRIIGALPS